MPQFRSAGISGYVGKKVMYRKKRLNRRRMRRKGRFNNRVRKIVENQMLCKNVYSILTPYQVTAAVNTVGTQAFKTIAIKNSGADLTSIRGAINTSQANLSVQPPIAEIYIDAYILKLALKNQEQTNAIFDLYEAVPRVSTQQDPVTALIDLQGQTNGGMTTAVWGYTPYQCSAWCEAFKILRKTRYLLAPGAVELIEIRDSRKQKVDLARYRAITASTPTGSYADPKYTKYWFACVMGEPTNDSVNVANVNTSSYKIDIVAREDYHYSWNVNNLNPIATLSNTLGAVANNEQEILVETGAKTVPPVQA